MHHAAKAGHVSVLRVLVAEMRKAKGVGGKRVGGDGGEREETILPGDDNTLMMDGGPFK